MKYATIKANAGAVPIQQACALLNVRRQGYYEWRLRGESQRQVADEALTVHIKNVFFASDRIYGARKIVSVLRRKGICLSRRRARRLMTAAGLVPVTFRRFVRTTNAKHAFSIFPNLLNGEFTAKAANRKWVSDMTYIFTDEGWLYLCSVIDLFSRRVVGWAVSSTIDRQLAITALERAVQNRSPGPGLVFHTDRGCQYASCDFRNAVAAMGGIQSMSRGGNPYDNACADSFFKSLKVECLDARHFATRNQAEQAVSAYLLFFNRRRIHASLGYLTPVEFEQKASEYTIAS